MARIGTDTKELGFKSRDQLKDLLVQIHMMKTHATEQGLQIPPETAALIANLGRLTERSAGADAVLSPRAGTGSGEDFDWMDIDRVASAMEAAFNVHGKLAEMVKPATPESLWASLPRKGWARITSPRITDWLTLTTLVGIILFVVGAWLARTNQDGWRMQISFLGAAVLGASFSGLYTAFKYISCRTFDPLRGSNYLTKVLLGTVSGLILANFGDSLMTGSGPTSKVIGPAALALVGGYSADAVNLILQRVSDTLVAAVRGSGDEAIKAKQAQLEAESKAGDVQQRQATATELGELLGTVTDPEIKAKIQRLMAAVGKGEDVSGTVTDTKAGSGPGTATVAGSKPGSGQDSGAATAGASETQDPTVAGGEDETA
jgi:hypothetical protein